jgi:SAM-dependent methyltransferase
MTMIDKFFPETGAGGYSSVDGTVEFYGRINSLLTAEMVVLDFGAGRGGWYEDDPVEFRRSIRLLKGKARQVIGCDVDPVVLQNRSVDTAFVCEAGEPMELAENSVDIIICDYVFEHTSDPSWLAAELGRILKPGGWICARTPHKFSYVALIARVIPNRRHGKVLSKVQPDRKSMDVFPTRYRLNSRTTLRKAFADSDYEDHTYFFAGEPAYYFGSRVIYQLLRFVAWVSPKPFYCNLFVFLRKRN